MKKESDLVELVNACNEVLSICRRHDYLWDDKGLWDKDNCYENEIKLPLFWGFIAQDESYHINITRKNKKFVFSGYNFSSEGLDSKKAAESMLSYGITPSKLKKSFYESLKMPLGNYLANKHLEEIK
jgi:hypothetical protein